MTRPQADHRGAGIAPIARTLDRHAGFRLSERTWRHLDAAATMAWLVLIPIAYTAGWLASVVFVSAISLYANVASHLAAWRADDNRALDARLDRLEQLVLERLDRVERLVVAA